MAISTHNTPKQQTLWVATSDLAPRNGHPFYSKLNSILDEDTFDSWLEHQCALYFASAGYFRNRTVKDPSRSFGN